MEVLVGKRYSRGWSALHQEVFQLSLKGMTTKEIVEKTQLPYDKVRNIMRTNKFKEHEVKCTEGAVAAARKLLEERLIEAATQILRIMRSGKPDERLRYDAAKEILYQCGMKPVEVIETRGRDYTPEEIKSSLNTVKEIQAIEEKLSTQGSGFLVTRTDADTKDVDASSVAPVSLNTNQGLEILQGADAPADTKVEEPQVV